MSPVVVDRDRADSVIAETVIRVKARRDAPCLPAQDPLDWLSMARPTIHGQPFDIPPALREPWLSTQPEVVISKASQVMASEMMVSLAFWCADTKQGQRGHVLYIFPASQQLGDFVRARIDTAIAASAHLLKRVKPLDGLKPVGKPADNVGLKRVSEGFIYFRGSNTEAGLISVDADLVIYDEVDRLKPGTIGLGAKRLGSSAMGWQRYISTPTFPETGIDALWARSDRRQWHVQCEHCGERQPMIFPDNLTEEGIVICRTCAGELDRLAEGEWIAETPGADIHGYHLSRFVSPRANMREIARIGYSILNKDITDSLTVQQFYNQDLGLPYIPEDAALVVVPAGWVRAAEAATFEPGKIEVVACDVARQGNDHTVVYSRRGRVLRQLWRVQGHNTMQTAGFLADYKAKNKFAHIVVDGVGVGAGVIDRLREQGVGVIEFQGGAAAEESGRYYNRNAEVYWRMREAFGHGMDVEPNDRLRRDVSTRRYEIQSDRRIKLQSKDEMRDLSIPSPDFGDAAAMTFVLDYHLDGQRLTAGSDVREQDTLRPAQQGFGNQHERQSLGIGRSPEYQPSRWSKMRGGHRR